MLLDGGDALQSATLPHVGQGLRPGERFLAALGMTALAPRQGCYPLWVQGCALLSSARSGGAGAPAPAA